MGTQEDRKAARIIIIPPHEAALTLDILRIRFEFVSFYKSAKVQHFGIFQKWEGKNVEGGVPYRQIIMRSEWYRGIRV